MDLLLPLWIYLCLDSCMWLGPYDLCDCLLSFSVRFSQLIHVVAHNYFISCPKHIPLWIYHILLAHSLDDGCFVFFPLSVIMNLLLWACMFNFCAEVCFQFLVVYLGMKFGLCGSSVFNLLRNCQVVFQSRYAFHFLPAAAEGSSVFISSSAFCFYYSHSSGYEVHSLLCFDLHLTDN